MRNGFMIIFREEQKFISIDIKYTRMNVMKKLPLVLIPLLLTLLDEPKGLDSTFGFNSSGWNAVELARKIVETMQ